MEFTAMQTLEIQHVTVSGRRALALRSFKEEAVLAHVVRCLPYPVLPIKTCNARIWSYPMPALMVAADWHTGGYVGASIAPNLEALEVGGCFLSQLEVAVFYADPQMR